MDQLAPRRIALIKPSALGDIVHALPVLSALRGRFPDARITWVVNKSYEPLVAGHPDLTDTLAFDRGVFKNRARAAVAYSFRFAAELRRRRFDLVIDLQGLLRTGLMCLATGAPRRVGFANAREGSRYAYTDKVHVPDAARIHAVDRYWRVAEALGAGDLPKRFHVPISTDARAWARAALAGLPRPVVAVAVGAKWVTKRWPPAHFADLLRRAQAAVGGACVFVGTGDDTAAALEVTAGLRGPAADFTGKTTLPQLVALLAAADAMVGNDTGPLHLAAAVGRPCVAPYTCTRVALHGPYGSVAGGVETSVPCGGSYLKTCDKMICMPELTPDRLWGQLSEVLDAWARSCRSA
ncbi:MAG: glycosyltransferase family 9 protein [Gemmataceae bacterium]|nr:glycosyltransferase family 9 protein [Gemmataceae bacterium]